MPDKIKIIFFGDITGSLARQAIKNIVPQWQKEYEIDLFIGNVENLAHGKGVTKKTLREMSEAGLKILTGGNHIWSKEDLTEIAETTDFKIAAPANDSRTPQKFISAKMTIKNNEIFVINLCGQVFMPADNLSNPFLKIDELLKNIPEEAIIIIDIHAEATSEKRALGFYLDGRVTAVLGTHTHVPTGDEQILAKGTGYLTDIGMVGPFPSVLGVKSEIIIEKFKTEEKIRHQLPETGQVEINAVLLEIENKKTINIQHLRKII